MRLSTGLTRVGLFVLGSIPALISFFFGHVVTGILLFVLGEAVAAGAALVAGVFSDLGSRWRERIADVLDQYLLMWVFRSGKRYRGYVLDSLRKVEEQGPATTAFYRPDLDEVFVDVALVLKAPHRIQSGLVGDSRNENYAGAARRHSIYDFIDRADAQVLAILGGPGSG